LPGPDSLASTGILVLVEGSSSGGRSLMRSRSSASTLRGTSEARMTCIDQAGPGGEQQDHRRPDASRPRSPGNREPGRRGRFYRRDGRRKIHGQVDPAGESSCSSTTRDGVDDGKTRRSRQAFRVHGQPDCGWIAGSLTSCSAFPAPSGSSTSSCERGEGPYERVSCPHASFPTDPDGRRLPGRWPRMSRRRVRRTV
jgi:hypothetical protein